MINLKKKFKFRKFFTSRKSSKISPITVSKPPATVSKSSEKRLWKEFREEDHILNEHVRSSLAPPENIYRWEATLIGPAGCPFEDGLFAVSVRIPTKYPYKPPKITFKTKVFHPNIDESGNINVDILGSNWSAALRIKVILLSICSILSDPVEPFYSGHPAVRLYRKDRKSYEKTAREWTVKYAKG